MVIVAIVRATAYAAVVAALLSASARERLETALRIGGERPERAHWVDIVWKPSDRVEPEQPPTTHGAHHHEIYGESGHRAATVSLLSGSYRIYAAGADDDVIFTVEVHDLGARVHLGHFKSGPRSHDAWGAFVLRSPCLCQISISLQDGSAPGRNTYDVAVAFIRQ